MIWDWDLWRYIIEENGDGLSPQMRRMTRAVNEFSRALGMELLPTVQRLNAVLAQMFAPKPWWRRLAARLRERAG